jgi:chemotaxis signal transduction protein
MNDRRPPSPWTSRAAALRDAFDATFAEAPSPPRPAPRRLLLIQVGTTACAVPLDHCSAVQPASAVTALPARELAFVGVTPVGGAILPVYDLAVRLGFARTAGAVPEWLLVSAGRQRVGFQVDGIDGYAERELTATGESVVTIDGTPRLLVDVSRLVEQIGASAAANDSRPPGPSPTADKE